MVCLPQFAAIVAQLLADVINKRPILIPNLSMSNFNSKSLSLSEDGILKINALLFPFHSLSAVISGFDSI